MKKKTHICGAHTCAYALCAGAFGAIIGCGPGELDDLATTGAQEIAARYGAQVSVRPLVTGESAIFSFPVRAAQTLGVVLAPVNPDERVADADVYVYVGTNSATRLVGVSQRITGRVDSVYYTMPAASTTATTALVRVFCYRGPCATAIAVNVGDAATDFVQPTLSGTYVNQRGFLERDGTCTIGQNTRAPRGECMCAPSSMANALAAHGDLALRDLRGVASLLFTTNNSAGAAQRGVLMDRVHSDYGLNCTESRAVSDARAAIRDGAVVLLRGTGFSSYGHYTRLLGFQGTDVIVDDPYGQLVSTGRWSPANTTDPTSQSGASQRYTWAQVERDASFIICR